MSETPETPTRPTTVATTHPTEPAKPYWLYRFAAWVVIVAGILFIVTTIFFAGFKLAGHHHHGCHHWHQHAAHAMGPGGMHHGGPGAGQRRPGVRCQLGSVATAAVRSVAGSGTRSRNPVPVKDFRDSTRMRKPRAITIAMSPAPPQRGAGLRVL
jgi:hypothetical protein